MSSAVGRTAKSVLQAHGVNTSKCDQELYKKSKNALLAHGDSLARSAERLALGFAEVEGSGLWMKLTTSHFAALAAGTPAARIRAFEMYRGNTLDHIVCSIRDFGPRNDKQGGGIRVWSNGTACNTSRRFSSPKGMRKTVERIMAKLDAKVLNAALESIEREDGERATNQLTTNLFPAMTVSYTRLSNSITAARVPAEMLLSFETKPHSMARLDESAIAWSAVLSSMGVVPNRARILGALAVAWGTRPPSSPHRDTIFNAAELKRDVEALGPEAAARINRFWRA
jgi:hypothetical protein